jgi:hypothetical protein
MTDFIISEESFLGLMFLAQTHPMVDVDKVSKLGAEIRSHLLSDHDVKAREQIMDEFKWMKPLCFGTHEPLCDTRCAWVVRKRCIESVR